MRSSDAKYFSLAETRQRLSFRATGVGGAGQARGHAAPVFDRRQGDGRHPRLGLPPHGAPRQPIKGGARGARGARLKGGGGGFFWHWKATAVLEGARSAPKHVPFCGFKLDSGRWMLHDCALRHARTRALLPPPPAAARRAGADHHAPGDVQAWRCPGRLGGGLGRHHHRLGLCWKHR